MLDNHYISLLAGYSVAIGLFWLIFLTARPGFLRRPAVSFKRPWLETGLVVLAGIGVIGVGQLFMRGLLLPETSELFESVNQIAIFSPLLALLAFRGGLGVKAYLPTSAAAPSLAVGAAFAVCALFAYSAAAGGAGGALRMGANMAQADNISYLVQVLLEDIAIAALLARLTAALGGRAAVVLAAALFAAAHIPAFLANGVAPSELYTLIFDTGLGVLVLGAVIVSRNIWWFWPIHSVMDLTQFYYKDVF